MRIAEVDPRDDASFRAWFDVLHVVELDLRPGEPGWLLEEQRAMALATDSGEQVHACVALDGERPVGVGRLVVPTLDNLTTGRAHVMVLPQERRRGVGTAVVEHLSATARRLGRTTLTFELDERPELEGVSPGRRFGEALGMTCALPEVRRDLALPMDPARVAECRAAASAAADYEVIRFGNRMDDALVQPMADLLRAMSVMYPTGDLDVEEEQWDPDRVRATERLFDEQQRERFAAIALLDGQPAGYTIIARPRSRPERAFQWDTLVLPEHRGRRLGLRLKLDVIEWLQSAPGETRLLSTWNAEVNGPMIAVNEALGCEVNGTLSTWQLHV